MPERLLHPDLPEEIVAAFEPLRVEVSGGEVDYSENISGAILLKKMAESYLNIARLDVYTEKYEKPKVYTNGQEISASFSHTKTALSAGLSREWNLGVDMESCSREVSQRLTGRMKHADENETLFNKLEPIRLWTMKEAALKQIGTGLRKPMNSVKIDKIKEHLFEVEFDNGKQAKICSFQYKDHWIAICYHKTTIT